MQLHHNSQNLKLVCYAPVSLSSGFVLQSDWEAAYQASIWMTAAPDEKVAVWAVAPLSLLDHYAQRDISPGVAFLPAGSMLVRLSGVLVTFTVPAVLGFDSGAVHFL